MVMSLSCQDEDKRPHPGPFLMIMKPIGCFELVMQLIVQPVNGTLVYMLCGCNLLIVRMGNRWVTSYIAPKIISAEPISISKTPDVFHSL